MKKTYYNFLLLLSVLACKKKEFSPEGPTDVRIRNISDLLFQEVIVSTSESLETLIHSEMLQMVQHLIISGLQKLIPKQKFLQKSI